MKKITKILLFVLGAILIWNLFCFISLVFFAFPTRTVQTLYSPDGKHRAVLKRMDAIDLNFTVKVDGKKVYSSPDFAPNKRVDFQERLVWDKTGTVVVLDVTGRRLFGFDIKSQKSLSDSELMLVEYAPEPDQWEYGFEGIWPENSIKKIYQH